MTSTELLGHSHPWKPDGTQTDSNCEAVESNTGKPIRSAARWNTATGLREPEKVCRYYKPSWLNW